MPQIYPVKRVTFGLIDLKGIAHLSQKWVTPLIGLGLADLVFVAEYGD
jgi:hypothetical protein